MDLKTFRGKGGGHLLPPFHQNHSVLAGILKLFVESQRFKLIKKPVDAILPGGVVGASQPIGVHMDHMGMPATREYAIQLARNGEGRRHDRLADAQPCSKTLCKRGFAGTKRS